ncbi:MAG: hypothetical protein OXU45_00655 [Candidatus Melainabacteria bacterium]|nr:hypothetical protein [Candidatus Melainabacteria bacterium]
MTDSNINPNQGFEPPAKVPATSGSENSTTGDKHEAPQNPNESKADEFRKDYDMRAQNPVLAAKLKQKINYQTNSKKNKSTPPPPRMKGQVGSAINPRRVKPAIPKRLQPIYDDNLDNLTRLSEALTEEQTGMHLINTYARGLLKSFGSSEMRSFASLASLFDMDESVANLDKASLLALLAEKREEFSDQPELKQILQNIIVQVQEVNLNYSNYLVPLLQLFLPIPFEFEFKEPDRDFDEDEEETKEDQSRQESNSEDEDEFDATASISIQTLNFNKIHILLCYKHKSKELIVNINGAPSAMEIAIPIEANLDDLVGDDLNEIDYLIKIWGDEKLAHVNKRVLKIRASGKLNPVMLQACNSILETIQDSDIDLDEDGARTGLL